MYSTTFFLYVRVDRRRIGTSAVGPAIAASVQPTKKPKLTASVLSRPNPLLAPSTSQEPTKSWEHSAIDIESIDLVPTVIEAKENDEVLKVVRTYLLQYLTSRTALVAHLKARNCSILTHFNCCDFLGSIIRGFFLK